MTAAAIAPLAAQDGSDYAILASLLALIVGVIYILGYLTRLGFLANLLSKPILIGYMAGVAVIMITGQFGQNQRCSLEADTGFRRGSGNFSPTWARPMAPTLTLSILVLIFLFTVQSRFPKHPGLYWLSYWQP